MRVSDPAAFEPLSRQSTAELIAERLRDAITRGQLAPGQQLGEAGLAAQFAVSRGPLREAMQRLVAEGLLRSERHRGIFVVELTEADVSDVYRVRKAIERAAIEEILCDDTAAARARLGVPVDAMIAAAARLDAAAVADADQQFHEVLVACAGSPRLHRAMRTLLLETRMLLGELQDTYPDLAEQVAEHVTLRDAIGSGDKAAALRLIDEHMDDAVRRLLALRAIRA
ncbi:GntR family transcriptional regulator [Mycobacterium kyorinense]|uniref:GntR family transcriptional regulator n=1 Tax=Mycobacterium kyorinense TaxID=487514 RepID=A0A1A2Z747_9MYCO|nr:GntR family transcriptional regulator [Mycobacterium kyorinense]OBI45302.1 GntR family transcriptional regulator [Mycobacterium kyorinense]